jgi:hypothetical protein
MHAGGGEDGFENKLVLNIDFDVIFVAVVGLVVLLRPTSVEVGIGFYIGSLRDARGDLRRFEGCDIKSLNELVKESWFAEWNRNPTPFVATF